MSLLLDKMAELNIEEMMDEFHSNNVMYPMYKWAKMYMRQVTALLQLEQLCIWFFAYNRLDYAQNILHICINCNNPFLMFGMNLKMEDLQ